MDERTRNLIDECKRQEESCLYTSASLFEWLKSLRFCRVVFIVAPIIFGALAAAPIFAKDPTFSWFNALCALIAGVTPAVYKALNFDISLTTIAKQAAEFKTLQDRFRQAWRVSAAGDFEAFRKEFDGLMSRLDKARAISLTPPERFFSKAQAKISAGHYKFSVDE